MTKNVIIAVAFVIIVIQLIAFNLVGKEDASHDPVRIPKDDFHFYTLPDTVTFCGEVIPIDNFDIRERFEREFYINVYDRTQMLLYLKRSGRFFPMFEEILTEMNAPDDLKYIAVSESALRVDAVSKAQAAGPWQFMKATAKLFGLEVNRYVDERYHVEKSTRAGIAFMKSLHARFGSWALAAAAYNNGPSNISNAQVTQRSKDYFDLFLNKETSRYVFRILVIKEIMKNYDKYGFALSESDYYRPVETETVTVRGAIPDLGLWAKQNKTNYKTVKLLNYWILQDRLPNGNWEIEIPTSEDPKPL